MKGVHNPECAGCICSTCRHDRDVGTVETGPLCCSMHHIDCDGYRDRCPDYEPDCEDAKRIIMTVDAIYKETCGGCGKELEWHNDFAYCPYCGRQLEERNNDVRT